MYSMMLMMAMGSAAPEVPSFHPKNHSPTVVVSQGCSCQGWGYANNWSEGTYAVTQWGQGCYAVTQWGAHPGFQHSSGCIGSCQGCRGTVIYTSGCTGCCGGCTGCCGGTVIYSSGCTGCQGGVIYSQPMAAPVEAMPLPAKPVEQKKESALPGEHNGVVTIKVPADATVFVNGVKVDQQGGERQFATTELEAGQGYKYTINAEFLRDGQPVRETREAVARAGQVTNVDFAAKPRQLTRSEVTVRIADGSKLLVNGVEKKMAADGRFETPILPAGETFAYTFTAVADGRETSRRIEFKAGEPLTVDLRDAAAAK